MTLSILESARIPEEQPDSVWSDILSSLERYSFFQTPRWSQLLASILPGAIPRHRWFRFSDGCEAVIPWLSLPKFPGARKLVSLAWGTYGGLLSRSPLSLEHLRVAVSSCLSLREPVCLVTVKPESQILESNPIQPSIFHIQERWTHLLRLDRDFDKVWGSHFKPRNRTAIRKAQKMGVAVRWSNRCETVAVMKDLYRRACKTWQGVETLPLEFFDALVDTPGEAMRLWFSEQEGKILAANVIFYGKGEVQYFAGAMDERFSEWNGSKILMSEIIRDACERGFSCFNFGAGGELGGVAQFKESFGGVKTPYLFLRITHPFLRFLPRYFGGG